MIDVRQLRYGCHVFVGLEYPTFSIPKRIVMVNEIRYEDVEVIDDLQHPDFENYNVSEIEGIAIADIIPILEKNGFEKQRDYYEKIISISGSLIIIDLDGRCDCVGNLSVGRTGVKYLHQLEACIADAGINFEFNFKQ